MNYYAVIDTNVLVSALLKSDSVPGNILELVFSGTIIPLLNVDIMNEYRDVLTRKKFHFTKDIVKNILSEIQRAGIYIDPENIDIPFPDPNDKIFYEIVMEARKSEDSYLVTGNIKHFPSKPYVVTPRQMMDLIIDNTLENN